MELLTELTKCKGDMDCGLAQVCVLVQETQKQLQKALERLSSQMTDMSKGWGKDIAHILNVSKDNVASLDYSLTALTVQMDSKHTCLERLITETKTQQTVLMVTMEAMKAQMAQIPSP